MGLKKADDLTPQNNSDVTYEQLLVQLQSGSQDEKRLAARDLATFENCSTALLAALNRETDVAVLEAVLDALQQNIDSDVVVSLLDYLRSENVFVRNEVIGLLQNFPDYVAPHILALLNDQDSDVRIFAIDILQLLAHPDTPQWLLSVIKDEVHINVVAAAVDRLAEVGTADMVPDLERLYAKFPDQPYLDFAIRTAIHRIAEGQ